MNFTMSERQKHWRDRVIAFMDAHVYPAVETYDRAGCSRAIAGKSFRSSKS